MIAPRLNNYYKLKDGSGNARNRLLIFKMPIKARPLLHYSARKNLIRKMIERI